MSMRGEDVDLAELAARALAADEPTHVPHALGARASHIAALDDALRSRARLRWLRPRVAFGALSAVAAAGAFVVWIGSASRTSPPSSIAVEKSIPAPPRARVEHATGLVKVGGFERALVADDEVAPGTLLQVPQAAHLALTLRSGTRLGLAEGTSVRVTDLGLLNHFDLEEGTFTAQVAKLASGQRFVISTPDAEIEVKGTRFLVAVAATPSPCGPRTRTTVKVEEGIVAVRFGETELRVTAGHQWPDCAAPAPGPPDTGASPNQRRPRRRLTQAAAEVAPTLDRPSTLAEQNDLFAAALAARHRGDLAEAQRWLGRLLSRYPDGQLAASARAEQRRLAELRSRSVTDP